VKPAPRLHVTYRQVDRPWRTRSRSRRRARAALIALGVAVVLPMPASALVALRHAAADGPPHARSVPALPRARAVPPVRGAPTRAPSPAAPSAPPRAQPAADAALRGAPPRARPAADPALRGAQTSLRNAERRARAAARRLTGPRRAELTAALRTLRRLAAQRRLTRDRIPLALLTLRRNVEVWTGRPFPAPGQRLEFAHGAAVFQYFPGRGVVFHPLASFGRLNVLARICLVRTQGERGGPRCRRRALRRGLDRLVGLASRRGGFAAWEYLVDYGGGRAPWISGMAQATAVQALARGAAALAEPRWSRVARSALGAFEHAPPTGVRIAVPGGAHYLMYSFAPRLRILNGFVQSLIGLHDMAALSHSARAKRLFAAGDGAARRAVPAYDTGAWSLYARGGREAPLHYHELVTTLLGQLCDRVRRAAYCEAERRFAGYLRGPPRLDLASRQRGRAGRAVPIVFTLSKAAAVRLRIRGAGGTVVARDLSLAHGRHAIGWTPRTGGRYTLELDATGPAGHRSVRRATVTISPRRPSERLRSPRQPATSPNRR